MTVGATETLLTVIIGLLAFISLQVERIIWRMDDARSERVTKRD